MKIMCDTNVIIDVLLDMAYKAVGKLLEIAKVCSVTNNDILIAFQKKAKDFEDCLVATCAKSIHCDCIVTRNKRDFEIRYFGILESYICSDFPGFLFCIYVKHNAVLRYGGRTFFLNYSSYHAKSLRNF